MLSLSKVALPEVDTAGEVQMGTPYMTLWADWGHDVVYKGPARFTQNEMSRSMLRGWPNTT